MHTIIPLPMSIDAAAGHYTLSLATAITFTPADSAELEPLARYLADRLRPATGYELPLRPGPAAPGDLRLTLVDDAALGDEGYELRVTEAGVALSAHRSAGLFRGIQTLRQLLPPAIEGPSARRGPWTLPCGVIRDLPRFAYRGMMLDVARHFFGVEDVKRLIDLAAAYKINHLHLHLSDDQGWRIEIKSWPRLTEVGGLTQVGGGRGGYYTQADYAELVAYAAARYITIVPEIDMPGHTNAAAVAYPELNGTDKEAVPHFGFEVGFSTLAIREETTYRFIDDVVGELAALTPGPYIHIGGDEAQATNHDDYLYFISRVQDIVRAHGKRMIGWEEIGQAVLEPGAVAQQWAPGHAAAAAKQGAQIIFSPATKVYLDMKYDEASPLGLAWSGYVSVADSYQWEPTALIEGLTEADILGVEGPLWTETTETMTDVEYLVFPRLLGLAEVGWSPARGRDWDSYRARLAAHGPRLAALGVNFFRSPDVEWR